MELQPGRFVGNQSNGQSESSALHPVERRSPSNIVGALIIRIELWGPLCYDYIKEPPK